jgi:hypothetical protein
MQCRVEGCSAGWRDSEGGEMRRVGGTQVGI